MAGEKIILSRVELDFGDSESKVISLNKEINALEKSNKSLADAQKKGTEATDAEIAAFEKNTATLKNLKSEREAQRKAIQANKVASEENQKVVEGEIKTYDSSGKTLNQNRAALAAQKKAYGDLNNPSKEATQAVKALNDKVKEQEAALGDSQRNVGNYGSILKGGFKGALGSAKDGVAGLSKTMLANPVGLLITFFLAFSEILKKNDAIADKFEQGMAAINAVLDVLIGRVITATKGIKDFIVGFATGDIEQIKRGLEGLGKSVDGVGAEIAAAAKQGASYAKGLQDLEDDTIALTATNKKLNSEFEENIIKSKNATLSNDERIKSIKSAQEANQKLGDSETALAQRKIDLLKIEQERQIANGQASEVIAREIAEAEEALEEVRSNAANRQEKIQNALDKRREDSAAKLAKQTEDEEKANQKLLDLENKRIDEFSKLSEKEFNDQAALDRRAYEDRVALKQAELELEIETQNQKIEAQIQYQSTANDYTQEAYDNLAQLSSDLIVKEGELATFKLGEVEKNSTAEANIKLETSKKITDIAKAQTNNIIQLGQKELEFNKQANQSKLNAATSIASQVQGLVKEGTVAAKIAASAAVIIQTATATIAALAPPPIGAGPLLGPILAGLTIATGAASLAKIAGVQFADGGIAEGNSHANGGIKFSVGGRVMEMEGGEAIINKRSTAMFKPQLSAINSAGGGVRFADGGLVQNSLRNSSMTDLAVTNTPVVYLSVVEFEKVQAGRNVNIVESSI